MSDEPDGDRADGPSDATPEEDPFIYPHADDDTEGVEGDDETAGDAEDSASGSGTSASGSDTSASGGDTAESGDGGSTREGLDASSRGARTSTSSSSGRGGRSQSGTGTSGSRTGTSSKRSGSSASGSGAGRRQSASGSSPGSAPASDDVGPHATDRRPHASESGRNHPSRSRSAGAASAGQRGSAGARRQSRARPSATETGPSGVDGWLRWFWTTEEGSAVYVRDVVTSVVAVLVVGLVLFAISGIWPPMVAVESGSMEPNMQVGDLVFIVDNERYTPDGAQEYQGQSTGVVPADRATDTGRSKFGGPGDVIVFKPNGREATTPVIHRAMLWVEEGENWYDRADSEAVGTANSCEQLNHCPAPHAGFITRGDANPRYDQQTTLSAPVRPEWIVGTAELRIPYLGHIRLAFSGQIAPAPDGGFDAAATDRQPPAFDERTPDAPGWDPNEAENESRAAPRSTASPSTPPATSSPASRPTAAAGAPRPVA